MTNKKPGRVGLAFVDLDPVDVIRAKDGQSGRISTSVQEIDGDLRLLDTGPGTGDPESGAERNQASLQTGYKQERKSASEPPPTEELSQVAKVTHQPGATTQTISHIDQADSIIAVKENGILTAPKLNTEPFNVRDDEVPAAAKPAEISTDAVLSVSSRPKRAARKTYTEVDWYEDLRPTDDESPKAKTSLACSPDPEYTNTRVWTSSSKRTRCQTGAHTSKRRKTIKRKDGSRGQKIDPTMQLPLTAAPRILQDPNAGSHANTPTISHDEGYQDPEVRETANIADANLPPAKAKQEQDPDQKTSSPLRYEVIVIPSSSPKDTQSDFGYPVDEVGEDPKEVIVTLTKGRGKSVGQKLAGALHDAGLSTEHHPVPNGLSTQLSQLATHGHGAWGTASGTSTSRESLELTNLPPEFSLEQVQSVPMLAREADMDLFATSWHEHTELLSKDPQPIKGAIENANAVNFRDAVVPRGLSLGEDFHQNPVELDEEGNQQRQVYEITEALTATTHQANEVLGLQVEHCKARPEASLHSPSDEEVPFRSSSVAITDMNIPDQAQGGTDEPTPESQKPLLTKPTPRNSIASHIPRSSIVDDNGSPRLLGRGRARHRQIGRTMRRRSARSESTSRCHSSAIDRCSDDYTPNARPSLSKYHLDMLLEYGVEAEDLLRGRKRSGFFRRDSNSGHRRRKRSTETDQFTGNQSRPQPMTISPEQTDVVSIGEKDCRSGRGHASADLSSSQRTIDEVGRCAIKSCEGRKPEQLLSISSSSQSTEFTSDSSQSDMQDGSEGPQWIRALQVAQQNAHNLLRETNQNLSVQLAAEQETIRQLLQIYRQGCNRILDDLFRAQEVRMELYRQQMSSMKEQHTQICQEMIRGLQELDHRVQQGA